MTTPEARGLAPVLNAREPTCNKRDALRLAEAWRRNQTRAVAVERLTGLPLLHDMMEPGPVERVYPRLLEIIDRQHEDPER